MTTDVIDYIGSFLNEHAVLSTIPIILLAISVLVLFIGWFCCTDYYDKYTEYMNRNSDDYQVLHMLVVFVLLIDASMVIVNGLTYPPHLVLNVIIVLVFIIPTAYSSFFKMHKYFKKKRGKDYDYS